MSWAIALAERGWVPDRLIRSGIRRLLARRLASLRQEPSESEFATARREDPITVATDDANRQHYEVPSQFFVEALGPHLKYSCCWFEQPSDSLAAAEEAMLQRTCERAELHDGQRILELGCGWGSLTLWMAERFPQASITAVSNSHTQREFILARARSRGLQNIQITTADIADFQPSATFDRVVSVEMFEHVRNHARLMARIHDWLTPEGKLFVHIFCHRSQPYLFESQGPGDWMAENFFTGGMMPSQHLLQHQAGELRLEQQWQVNGQHYARTCDAWLAQVDARRQLALAALAAGSDPLPAEQQLQRWRMFFMACAELFAAADGNEWFVGHYLFAPARVQAATPG